ncbi:diguanylate cyclase (GGDEF) domain-containing protein [Roseateles sp. YR242]|uniref:putative bifunctional diguanylate cyclase/phosphodiesterase n=1 Tax=Roseateles sp. YR242 TaxID=1855305 RepID=UPI0008AA9872|nr:EAL domain-containing protein [Roseateles sp. YR242]SEL28693.1 diguanylate cyclase (GGDEF) domain-containing protein [Roseateles sp. YR242]
MIKLKAPSLSLRSVILLAVVVGIVAPAALLVVFSDSVMRRSLEPVLENQRAAVLTLAATGLADPLWTVDSPAVQRALDQLLADVNVCGVELSEERPETPAIVRAKCSPEWPIVTLVAMIRKDDRVLGTLRVQFDDAAQERMLAEGRRQTALIVGIQILAGITIVLLVLYVRLVRPIDRLKQVASAIAQRRPVPRLRWNRKDELGQLGVHLDEAGEQIAGLLADMESKNAQLHQLAMYDHLTGLPNRTLFREVFLHEAAVARRGRSPLALLFVDLDRFKAINDSLGHAAGDRMLLQASERLRQTVRESDLACRVSGDEFLMLMRADSEDVAHAAARLIETLAAPLQLAGGVASVSASVGIALFPRDGEDFETLVRHADLAMYRAKQLGRSRYSFFHQDMDEAATQRLEMERELKLALERKELVLHYQALVDARTGEWRGLEALMRWQHPQRGLLAPGHFITLAEETGLILDLGWQTIEIACAQLASWKAAGRHPGVIAINLSALQFREQGLPERLADAMRRHGVAPGELAIELTESTLLSDSDIALQTLGRLQALGLSLSVDDFGTGYSSLAYLKLLRPARLKIDRAFVREIASSADDRALVQAMMGMASALSIEVVGEGVETDEQRQTLLELGCWWQQGYFFARPQAVEAITERLSPWPVQEPSASAPRPA